MIVHDPAPARPLANMSARPRTTVTRRVPALRELWVHFLPLTAAAVGADELARLDTWWVAAGLRGAMLLHAVDGDLCRHVRLERCDTPELTLNVLLRARGSLLLADMPLLDVYDGAQPGFASDDPRLVALAGRAA